MGGSNGALTTGTGSEPIFRLNALLASESGPGLILRDPNQWWQLSLINHRMQVGIVSFPAVQFWSQNGFIGGTNPTQTTMWAAVAYI